MRRFIVAVVLAVVAVVSGHALVAADGPNRAGIVVSFGDGRSDSVCVEFTETEISGAELLRRAGYPVVAAGSGMGAAMCMIDGVGCADPNDCWCQCHGAGCRYWAYYTLADGTWQYSAIGSSLRKVRNRDVDGWAWGAGSAGSGAKPAPVTFEDICSEEIPQPPVTPPPAAPTMPQVAPTETAVEVATATPLPPTATVAGQTPPATATSLRPTLSSTTPVAAVAGATANKETSVPWQLPVFAVLAAGLLGMAVVLAKRRSDG
jgi:hypothetical protein